LLIQTVSQNDNPQWHYHPDVVVTSACDDDGLQAQMLAELLRQRINSLSVVVDCSGTKLKRQHQTALQSQCRAIVTINEDGAIRLWDLATSEQTIVVEKELIDWLQQHR
jgi:Histidyl-tRNA synthetase